MPNDHAPILLAANVGGPLAPDWLVIGCASVVGLAVILYTLAIQRMKMPASRRRLRTVNGILMIPLLVLLSYAILLPANPPHRTFLLTWMAVMGLVGMVLIIAVLDIGNTLRLYAAERAEVAKESARRLAMEATAIAKTRAKQPPASSPPSGGDAGNSEPTDKGGAP